MTNSESEKTDGQTEGIGDDQLPEDLQPSEDNPLAEPLEDRDDAHSIDELDMQGGKTPEGSGDEDEASGGDGEATSGGADGNTSGS
jgi:hypothetical protein